MNRRRFLKYVGASAAVIGASALGLEYWLSPKNRSQLTAIQTTSSTPETSTSTSATTTSALETTAYPGTLSTLVDLDDPKSGYPELADELRKLPDYHQNASQSNLAVQRIATLALQSDDHEVEEAFQVILRGGAPPELPYGVPDWNTELRQLQTSPI